MGGVIAHPIAAAVSWVILVLGVGGAVAVSPKYRFVLVLAAIILVGIFTARAARLMWKDQRDRADAAEAAFVPGALTGDQVSIGHVEHLTINMAPGQSVPPGQIQTTPAAPVAPETTKPAPETEVPDAAEPEAPEDSPAPPTTEPPTTEGQ